MNTTPQPQPGSDRRESPRFQPSYFATKPTRWTLFWRTFLPWQMVRFASINLRMIVIIFRSHH
jgi:hypothetical protein